MSALSSVQDLGDNLQDCVEPNLKKYDTLIDVYMQKLGMRAGLTDSSAPAAAATVRENKRDGKEDRDWKKGCYERKI